MMSLRPRVPAAVPDHTAQVARMTFPQGCLGMRIRDALGPLFADADFADLFSQRGQPAWPPGQPALACVLQHSEGLSDRQAATAVRARIGWKYALVRHEAPLFRVGVKGPRRRPVAAGR